jgi:hypothetical protein
MQRGARPLETAQQFEQGRSGPKVAVAKRAVPLPGSGLRRRSSRRAVGSSDLPFSRGNPMPPTARQEGGGGRAGAEGDARAGGRGRRRGRRRAGFRRPRRCASAAARRGSRGNAVGTPRRPPSVAGESGGGSSRGFYAARARWTGMIQLGRRPGGGGHGPGRSIAPPFRLHAQVATQQEAGVSVRWDSVGSGSSQYALNSTATARSRVRLCVRSYRARAVSGSSLTLTRVRHGTNHS